MRLLILVMTALIAITAPAAAQNYDIFGIFGQSNSTNVGQGPYYDPLQSTAVDSRIVQLGRYGANQLKTIPATQTFAGKTVECLEYWRTTPCDASSARHGFSVAFARRYVANKLPADRKVLIVPGGLGARSILEWNGSLILVPESPLLYSDFVGRLKYLLAHKSNRLKGLIMSEIETDFLFAKAKTASAQHGMTPDRYADELRKLFTNLRTEFPDVPIITVKMVHSWFPGDPVKAAMEQKLVAVTKEFGGKVVGGTQGLIANPDPEPMHYNAQSDRILGAQAMDAYTILRP